jgi:hypothetical protein
MTMFLCDLGSYDHVSLLPTVQSTSIPQATVEIPRCETARVTPWPRCYTVYVYCEYTRSLPLSEGITAHETHRVTPCR